ncbi:MAG: glycerol-3-phosphate 1-O-acyltransferase PlsY [Planctomycetota bacterium]|jgi:glycerol-3-phosphate acyltransferase PlsY
MPPILLVVCSYLIGSIPFAWLLVKITLRKDIRDYGSGNVGATNAARLYPGRLRLVVFLLIFVLDAGKGMVAAGLLPRWIGMNYDPWPVVAALCAVIGHCFTPFLKTLGGKGVATTIGALMAVEPVAMLIALGAFFLVYLKTRIVSTGSIALAVVLPVACWFRDADASVIGVTSLLGVVVVLRHMSNIKRLIKGVEH